jgi:hypothetical protein
VLSFFAAPAMPSHVFHLISEFEQNFLLLLLALLLPFHL